MKIAFVYAGGRRDRLEEARAGRAASEFFYGALELERRGWEVGIFDVDEGGVGWLARALNAGLGWAAPVKLRGEALAGVAGLVGELNRFDCVIGAATGVAMGLGVLKRLGRLRAELVGIHCGIVNFPIRGARLAVSRWALGGQRCVLFAEAERAEVLGRFGVDAVVDDFGVDVGFWCEDGAMGAGGEGDYVLAVGNDARRDYATLVDAVRGTGHRVKVLTNRELADDLPDNVEHLRGSWHKPAVTDAELRELYRGARVVVVPLEESRQPAGQSVALQAMACGKTVVMSRTRGLWTGDNFVDGEHLRLVEGGEPRALREALQEAALDRRTIRGRVVERGSIENFADVMGKIARGAVD